MKILHVVSISFSIKYFIGNQFQYFGQSGYTFYVACSDSLELTELSKKYNFKAVPIPILRNISPLQDLISIWRLYRFIKKNNFDVVIAHSPKGGLIGMIASFLARTPKRVFFRHGLVFETATGIKRRLLIFIERFTSFCAHRVVNVSPSVERKSVLLKLNSNSKNIILGKGTCNGVNIQKFYPNSRNKNLGKIVVGFVGRLSNDKGISELIQAWKLLEVRFNNIELLLIGPKDERDKLVLETFRELEHNRSIRYIGEVKDTSCYYHQMDIFILPSYREGFPTVTLEASASGLPIITTKNTGCIDSIIENETGVFTELNPPSIADKIAYYVENPEIRSLHGENGRKFVVENFSEDLIYHEIENQVLK